MINARELRLGNYVNTPQGIKRVTTISVDGWSTHTESEPIPLTEEWFLKFGFIIRFFNEDTNKPLMWKVEGNRHIELYFEKQVQSYVFMINKLQYSTEIKYVHQLQNLYQCLCGKELLLINQ